MKKKLLVTVFVLLLSLLGCSNNENKIEYTQIKFKQKLETLKKYDGKYVKIIGFMSTLSPLQGKYVYLMNMPYQQCPFCVPNSNEIANTLAVYAPEGERFDFVDYPVEARGKLEFGDFKDEGGFEYKVRMVDAEIKKADVSNMSNEIKLYTNLVDKGFAKDFTSITEEALKTVKYKENGVSPQEVKKIDMSKFDNMYKLIDSLGRDKYKKPLEALDMLKYAVEAINKDIESGNVEKLELHANDVVNAYNLFYEWLISPNL